MAHGVSLHLAKIPPNRFYNYQPSLRVDGWCSTPIKDAFRPAGPQVAKREPMAQRAEKRATPEFQAALQRRREGRRTYSGQQLPREDR